jgi:hypothetical protein
VLQNRVVNRLINVNVKPGASVEAMNNKEAMDNDQSRSGAGFV